MLQGDVIRNKKHKAPRPSNVNTVVKKKREVSEEVSDPVPGPGIFYTIPFHQCNAFANFVENQCSYYFDI